MYFKQSETWKAFSPAYLCTFTNSTILTLYEYLKEHQEKLNVWRVTGILMPTFIQQSKGWWYQFLMMMTGNSIISNSYFKILLWLQWHFIFSSNVSHSAVDSFNPVSLTTNEDESHNWMSKVWMRYEIMSADHLFSLPFSPFTLRLSRHQRSQDVGAI